MSRTRHALMHLAACTALAVASCGRESPTSPTFDTATGEHRLSVVSADSVVYGPATIIRDTGKPRTDSAAFTAHAGDTLTVVISSPAAQGLNATVDLNGSRVYSSTDGHPVPDTIRVIARATNSLRIWMAGKPGSTLRIVVSVRLASGPVENRVLTTIFGSSVAGSIPLGTVEYPLGTTLHYSFRPNAGFVRLRVVVDGLLASDTGTLTMDRAHWIAATADTVITLDGTEMSLSQALRSLLTSATIREDWIAYQAAVEQAAGAWGVAADAHLARVERATIDPVADLHKLIHLDSALAGMETSADPLVDSEAVSNDAASSAERATSGTRKAALATEVGEREATQIFLVNGIFTTRGGFRDDGTLFRDLLRQDPAGRFPRATVGLTNFYNPSILSMDSLFALAGLCEREAALGSLFRPLVEYAEYGGYYLGCLARQVAVENDLTEMFSWARLAVGYVDPSSAEITRLAIHIDSARVKRARHVLVVGHSEGSLMTQLAIERLKDLGRFDEDTAVRCIGTVSVAGVGTSNWPLSERHARFVVAKGDLVTLLPPSLRNTRRVVEDAATRAVDSAYAALERNGRPIEVMLPMGTLDPVDIHHLNRYLQSEVTGPLIRNELDSLYRTCAVGAVSVAPATATVQLFGAYPFNATWNALDGLPLATADTVVWSVDSAFASVARNGRLLAGGTAGPTTLQAKVRNAVGTASISIVDDSVQATYVPPVVTVTERTLTDYQFTYPDPLQGLPNLPPLPFCGGVRFMTITASAMPGASIASVVLYSRSIATPYEYFSGNPPLDTEFLNAARDCVMPSGPEPNFLDFSWYRLVVTDTHGKVTETISPNP